MSQESSVPRASQKSPPLFQHQNSLTVAEVILEQFRLWGVKRIYGIIGDSIFGLMDAIAKQNTIQFIAVKHESTAALMASTEARLTGHLSVCVAQTGPGLANMINGLAEAQMEHLPVLAITGQAPLQKIGTQYKQYIDQQELVKPIASYSSLLVHPDAIIEVLTHAMYKSLVAYTVTHLSIPTDLFAMTTLSTPRPAIHMATPKPDTNKIREAVGRMKNAKRPFILIGANARACSQKAIQLAKCWGSGIVNAYGSVGVVPFECPIMLGGLGEGGNDSTTNLFKHADFILQIGTTWWPEKDVPDQTQIILIHSSEQHLNMSVPFEMGVFGDLFDIMTLLLEEFEAQAYQRNEEWVNQIEDTKRKWIESNEHERNQTLFPLHPSRIVKSIESGISEDAIIALDIGDSNLWFQRNFQAKQQQVLASNQWRTMGFALPSALAAKSCMSHRQVICIVGDGGLEMGLAELLTAARYELKITLILFNNGSYQMEIDKMKMKGYVPYGANLTNPDFVKIADACGWNAIRINNSDHLEKVLQETVNSQKPIFLDVPTAQIPYPDYIQSIKE